MENQEKQHKRRVRYSGTHPKSYKEKYKEHNPEKYADTIQKVIGKGSTPAGMHISIMVEEILDFLDIKPGQRGLDATLGYGGHTKAMLEKLKTILKKVLPDMDVEGVTPETRLVDDLGFDSLAMMMMAMEIEDSFGFRFTELVKFETVGDVCGYLESRI